VKPFFSIIIPALNEERYLPLLLRDISRQTFQDFEVIIVDGNSQDKTVKKARSFSNLIKNLTIISSSRNVSIQRNNGARIAKGKHLLFNDADNRLPKYFLEGLHYQVRVNPSDVYTTWFLPDTNLASDKAIATLYNLEIEALKQLNTPGAVGALIGCKKKVFSTVGGFNPKVGFAEDTEFIRQSVKRGFNFKIIQEPRFIYSLRRFRRDGLIKSIQKYAVLNLKYLTNRKVDQVKEYPMGGNIQKEHPKSYDIINFIDQTLKTTIKDPKIIEKFKAFLNLEED